MANYSVVYKELGQTVAEENQIEFTCSYGGKFYVNTLLELKGRGIKKSGDGSDHKRGLKSYFVTELAMEKLKKEYACTYTANL